MMTQNADKNRNQIHFFCMDDIVPKDHLLRLIERAINRSFIYELVEEKYSPDHGHPSIDPVVLIKIPLIQYLYGIKSMRQTIKEIEVNVAYRWFLGLEIQDRVPHFSTFGKNYTRRFKDTDLFEQIFSHILEQCYKWKFVDPSEIFVDATHVKARANNKRIAPLFPYKRPMTKEGFFKKYEYAYDEYYDCYICPNNKTLEYSTTNREGYKEYKSKGYVCKKCLYIGKCTEKPEWK